MVQITPEPAKDEIIALRDLVAKKIEDEVLQPFIDMKYLGKFNSDDDYAGRFLKHHDNDTKLASEMAVDTLKWRKSNSVNEITEDTLDTSLLEKKLLGVHNRDIDGCKMLIFHVKNYFKDEIDPDKIKKLLIYYIERMEREEEGKWITIFFDMKDTGFKNMDMEFIQYFINLFKWYYPHILNYIIVFEMPWLLNALWKIIRGWLPPKSLDKIKFVDQKTLLSFVPEDQCLVAWGGPDEYDFTFEPEPKHSVTQYNGDIINRKVHFDRITSIKQELNEVKAEQNKKILNCLKFQVEPSDEILFEANRIGVVSFLKLINICNDKQYVFKIKTTSPEKYRVCPSIGVVSPSSEIEVAVTLNGKSNPSLLVRDKFLILAFPSLVEKIDHQVFFDLQKRTNKLDITEVRLRVGLSNNSDTVETSAINSLGKEASPNPFLTMSKVDQILTRQIALEEQIYSLRKVLYVFIFLLVILFLLIFYTRNSLASTVINRTASAPTGPPLRSRDL